jgi:malate synthase
MTVPFMRAYTELLVRTCHARGAAAIGGMAAFIPSRRDAAINEIALAKVREDKEREARMGFDGSWVAHPDLVRIAREPFTSMPATSAGQPDAVRGDTRETADALLAFTVPGGTITAEGVRNNVSVALQYLDAWLRGSGAVGINNLMEDTATAEIARAQLWQWIHHHASLAEGGTVTAELYCDVRRQEVHALEQARSAADGSRVHQAAELLDALVLSDAFVEFLTIPAYRYLDNAQVDEVHV